MEDYLKWLYEEKEDKGKDLAYRLQQARNKLTPIIDDILVSTVELMLKGDDKFISQQTLTAEQYEDVVWTTRMLRDIEYEFRNYDKGYQLPNSNIIVSNVLVPNNKDKSVVIDEETVIELLQVYEQMGVIIQRLVNEGVPTTPTRAKSSAKSILKINEDVISPSSSATEIQQEIDDTDVTEETDDIDQLERKSTLSALLNSSSSNLGKRQSESAASKKSKIRTSEDEHVTTPHLSKKHSETAVSKKSTVRTSEDEYVTTTEQKSEPTIFIRIQCCTGSDQEYSDGPVITCAKDCPSQYHVKLDGQPVTLKMNQTKVKDGAVYCVKTGEDCEGEDIRVIIKQCPQCMSTVIGSSTKISEFVGESHESITLHGKQGDETRMSYSSSDEDLCRCHKKGEICIEKCVPLTPPCRCKMDVVLDADSVDKSTVKVRTPSRTSEEHMLSPSHTSEEHMRSPSHTSEEQMVSPSRTSEEQMVSPSRTSEEQVGSPSRTSEEQMGSPSRTSEEQVGSPSRTSEEQVGSPSRTSEEQMGSPSHTSEEQMGSPSHISEEQMGAPSHTSEEQMATRVSSKSSVGVDINEKMSSVVAEPEPFAPLTRRKVCSSMEFDVTKAQTRLREHEIEHGNAHVVIELKNLGVDQILRACRPARCCRKAILNERQRTALPYCVSLKSLPLIGNDVEVIKQSIDMSVKKINNSLDLTQAYKDKLAFYVSLGRDDFRMNSNHWVIPVYDLKLTPGPSIIQDRFFVLKNIVGLPKQLESVARLMGAINNEENDSRTFERTDKYFVLKRPIIVRAPKSEESEAEESKQSIYRRRVRSSSTRTVRFKQHSKRTSSSTIYKSENVWSNISHEDWQLVFCQEQINTECSSKFTFDTKTNHKDKACEVSCQNLASPVVAVDKPVNKVASLQRTETCGDHTLSSLTKIFDLHVRRLNRKRQTKLTRKKSNTVICIDRRLPRPKSMPVLKSNVAKTLKVRRIKSFENFFGKKQLCERAKLKEDIVRCLRRPTAKPDAKKLEYYIGLVNGDLIWSQNYDTYYNYSNETPPKAPVSDPMYIRRVTPEESRRGQPTPTVIPPQTEDGRSTISELPEEDLIYAQNVAGPPTETRPPPHQTFSAFSMGPEDQNEPWAPLVASETSLPRLREEIVQKEAVQRVEARPVSDENLVAKTPKNVSRPVSEEKLVAKTSKNVCSEKNLCTKNKCTDCKTKQCSEKKCNPRDVVISIKKVNKGICVEAIAPKACTKEVCELYKNKNLVDEKAGSSKVKETECEKYTFTAKDNIEIYINNQKICLGNKNKNKETKSEKNKK